MKRSTNIRLGPQARFSRPQNLRGPFSIRDVEDDAEESRIAVRRTMRVHLLMQPQRPVVYRERAERELVNAGAALPSPRPYLRGLGPIVEVDPTQPEFRIGEPPFGRVAEDLFRTTADEDEPRRLDLGLPKNGTDLLDQIAIAFLRRSDRFSQEKLCIAGCHRFQHRQQLRFAGFLALQRGRVLRAIVGHQNGELVSRDAVSAPASLRSAMRGIRRGAIAVVHCSL